jgi:hypothetical protein
MTSFIAMLNRERETLLGTIAWLSDAALDCPNVVGARSIKDVLAHLAAREEAVVQRLREWRSSGAQPEPLCHFDCDTDAAGAEQQQLGTRPSPTEQVLALERVRSDLLDLVADLGERTLDHARPWPGWDGTVAEYVRAMVGDHEREHCAAIRAAVSQLSGSLEYWPGLRASRELAVTATGSRHCRC